MSIRIAIFALIPIFAFADVETVDDYFERLEAGYKIVRASTNHEKIQELNSEAFRIATEARAVNAVICTNAKPNIDRIWQAKREIVDVSHSMEEHASEGLKPAINEIRMAAVLMHMKAKRNYLRCIGQQPQ